MINLADLTMEEGSKHYQPSRDRGKLQAIRMRKSTITEDKLYLWLRAIS